MKLTRCNHFLSGLALLLASASTFAGFINVGGVVWDPESVFTGSGPQPDFIAKGDMFETALTSLAPGTEVTGQGKVNTINNTTNIPDLCPGCELTFTFKMNLVSATDTGFTFENLNIKYWVDLTPDYNGNAETAGDGVGTAIGVVGNDAHNGTITDLGSLPDANSTNLLWLELGLHVDSGTGLPVPLTGTGTNIGTGSDTGNGSAGLDVIGGNAAWNFDTNTFLDGADMVFSSSFQPVFGVPGLLSGTFEIRGDSIPEPAPFALIGLALLGMAGAKRKEA